MLRFQSAVAAPARPGGPRGARRCSACRAAATTSSRRLDEQVTAAWAEVLSQYQRRSDLIPNIVATVKGEANFEQETLTKVIEARAKATAIQATPALVNDPGGVRQVPAGAGRAERRAQPPARRHRELSEPEGEPGVPGPARPARGHREPHHRRAQQVHRRGPAVQHQGAQRADQLHGDDLRLQDQAELHRHQRGADLGAAAGELRQARVALIRADRRRDARCSSPRRPCSPRSSSAPRAAAGRRRRCRS